MDVSKTLTGGSLFSGIGGMDKGFEDAGIEIRWQVEIDPYCRRVLKKHWPDVKRYGDVRKLKRLPPVDILFGGFPCQPVSLAGSREFQKDKRWLWPEFNRIIRMLRPRWVVIENVEGLQTNGLAEILKALAESGYDAEWDRLPASAFGAPHLRYRIFILAYPRTDEQEPRIFREEWERNFRAGDYIASHAALRKGSLSRFDAEAEAVPFKVGIARLGIAHGRGWPVEPRVARVAHGVPAYVDRIRGLGNAVVPRVTEWIGCRIIEYEIGR